jgi:O-antigen/teichoic acid export membrane protein
MTGIRRLINNTGFSFLSSFFRIGTNFAVFILIARTVSIEDFGKFTFSLTFAVLFFYISNFGIARLTVLDISRNKNLIADHFGNVMVAKAFLSLITFILACILIKLMGYPPYTRVLVYLLTISVIINSYTAYLNALFRGIEKLKYETAVAFVNNLSLLALIYTSLILGYGILGAAYSFIISRLFGCFFALGVYTVKVGKISVNADYYLVKRILRKAMPFALLTGLTAVLYDIDTILLSYLGNDQSVGYYQAAMKIIVSFTVIPLILDNSFFPILSKSHNQPKEFKNLSRQLITILFIIGVPITIGLFALSEKLVLFIYGDSFIKSSKALQILSIALLLRFAFRGYETILIAIGKQNIILVVILFATILNLVMNINFIPKFGLEGAAAAAAITSFFILTSYLFILHKALGTFLMEKNFL